MISNKDRSKYIGASDTKYVMMDWETKTFRKWWLVKLGLEQNDFDNKYTRAGNNYEHKIVDALNIKGIIKDKQIIVLEKLRVNLDANTENEIHEIKTYKYINGFDLKKHQDYQDQVQVEMFASGIHNAYIDTYGLSEEEYRNFFEDIDINRLSHYKIEYDEKWINTKYLPRITILIQCLKELRFPTKEEYNKIKEEKRKKEK